MSFHSNQIGGIVTISSLKHSIDNDKWNEMELFWKILSMTTRF